MRCAVVVDCESTCDARARDVELAKFEAFLKQHETLDISALVRGSQRLAYPIKGYAYPATPFCLRM